MTEIKSSSPGDKKTTLTDIKDLLMYVLVLMNALLDTVLSVAASVVFSRLLISGDVESNPGPGEYHIRLRHKTYANNYVNSKHTDLDYNSVDADQILGRSCTLLTNSALIFSCDIGEDDLPDVLEEVHSIKSAYFSLGQWLRLSTDDLKAIRTAYPDESMADQVLNDVLLLWLNQKYKIEKFGLPTWRMLVEAVDKKTGGNNHELAKQIASNHPTGV